MNENNLKVGQKVKFSDDRLWFTVQARNERYIILTTSKYHSIIDLDQGVRGADNLVFHNGYDNQKECEDRLNDFISGEIEVSRRNRVLVQIAEVKEG